jgi:uncharacterized protein YecE (DUF72 family)
MMGCMMSLNKKPGKIYIGTSGWSYPHWKNGFYKDISKKEWLNYCSKKFTGIEINATFYGSQKKETFQRWRDETQRDFIFTMKGNRYITHNKKLINPQEALQRERKQAMGLGKKLAVVVWQLPVNFKKNIDRLRAFAEALKAWPEVRHTIEFRNRSWFQEDVAQCMRDHGIAACQSDAADWPLWDIITTDLVYVRLHGHTSTYSSAYSTDSLKKWVDRIQLWASKGCDVHVYFDNDAKGAAPKDAIRLINLLE